MVARVTCAEAVLADSKDPMEEPEDAEADDVDIQAAREAGRRQWAAEATATGPWQGHSWAKLPGQWAPTVVTTSRCTTC